MLAGRSHEFLPRMRTLAGRRHDDRGQLDSARGAGALTVLDATGSRLVVAWPTIIPTPTLSNFRIWQSSLLGIALFFYFSACTGDHSAYNEDVHEIEGAVR
jgi:hypothetical protein